MESGEIPPVPGCFGGTGCSVPFPETAGIPLRDFVTEISGKSVYTKDKANERMDSTMAVLIVTQKNFKEATGGSKPVLLDFYADWCGPCRMVSPLVDEIAKENPQYVVGKVNVDEEPALAQAFGVASIPTLVVLKDGKIAGRSVGARPKAQILSMLEGQLA